MLGTRPPTNTKHIAAMPLHRNTRINAECLVIYRASQSISALGKSPDKDGLTR
jgi:hypothetical protein